MTSKPEKSYSYVYASLTFVVLISFIEFNQLKCFVALKDLEKSIETKIRANSEKKAIKEQAIEMRFFIGNMAHDLKTPLTGLVNNISNLSDFLNMRLTSDSSNPDVVSFKLSDMRESFEILNVMSSMCSFVSMSINRSIDFSKANLNVKLVPNQESVDLYWLINWAIKCVLDTQTKIPIQFIKPQDSSISPFVFTDKLWFMENLLCLVSNAAKYSHVGSISVECKLTTRATDDDHDKMYILLEVFDNGIGVPSHLRSNLFMPFAQTMRRAGGTGLGLFSLLKRMEALGGSCGLKDRPDGATGSCFWFDFPYKPDLDMTHESAVANDSFKFVGIQTPQTPQSFNPYLGKLVLVVDDSLVILKSASKSLENRGFIVETAENGAKALELMIRNKYYVVLMDFNMPVMDGIESTRRLREHEMETTTPHKDRQIIIGMSADDDAIVREEGFNMDAFISKPFSTAEFLEKCNILLQ